MVAGLLRRELADGREDTECITREHDDVAGLAVDGAGYMRIRDKLDRVRATCVLRDADIVIVRSSRCRIVDDVLEDAAKPDGVEDLGLLFGREVDGLGVASTFDVEDAGVGPDMLIVTNEKTAWVGTKGRLSGSRQAEEERYIAVVNADVSGRV